MTGDETLEEYSAVYEGRRIYFCCPHCLEEFERDPARYVAELPPEKPSDRVSSQAGADANSRGDADTESMHPVTAWLSAHWYLWLLGLILVVGRPFLARRVRDPESILGQLTRPVVTAAVFGIVLLVDIAQGHLEAVRELIIGYWWVLVVAAGTVLARLKLLASLCVIQLAIIAALLIHDYQTGIQEQAQRDKAAEQEAREQLLDRIHFATFHDFGDPPTPPRPRWDNRLQATFYRGNDERNARLFNNGNYRTATFRIDVRTAEDKLVSYGSEVAGREIFVRLEIVRAPYTPDFFYSPSLLAGIFATGSAVRFPTRASAPPDRLSLTEIESMQRWELRYPLGALSDGTHHGVVYIRQDHKEAGEIKGARFHYGLEYRFVIAGGRVQPESDYWMGPLYRTRKVTLSRLPYSEWFSHEPIPELPGPHRSTDPKLLGTEDHGG